MKLVFSILGPPNSLQRTRLKDVASAAVGEFALSELSPGVFGATIVTDATPATFEVRQVSAQTTAAYDASVIVTASGDITPEGEPTAIPIVLTISGDTPVSLSMTALARGDNGQTPRGITLPDLSTVEGSGWTQNGSVWTFSFTDPDGEAASYRYTFVATWSDGSTDTETSTIETMDDGPAGRYTSITLLDQRFGATNVKAWSSTDGTGARDDDAIAAAIAWAEDFIDAFFAGSIYTIPFVATGASLPHNLTNWATVGAGWWLFTKRGLLNEGASTVIDPLWDKVQAEMQRYRAGYPLQLQGVQLNSAVSLGVTIVDPRANVISDGAALLPTSQSRRGGVRFINGYGYALNGQ